MRFPHEVVSVVVVFSFIISIAARPLTAGTRGEPNSLVPPGFLQIPSDSVIEVTLQNGEKYKGRVVEASQNPEGFGLRAERGSSISDARGVAYREFADVDVEHYIINKLKGWAVPQVAFGIPLGQRIKLRLQNGETTKGRFAKVADKGF